MMAKEVNLDNRPQIGEGIDFMDVGKFDLYGGF